MTREKTDSPAVAPKGASQPETVPERPHGRRQVTDAIFSAMDRLYAEGGDVSIRAIAKAANINHSLILHYFGSKKGLLQAFVNHERDRITAEIADNDGPVGGFGDVAARSFEYQGYCRALGLWAAEGEDDGELLFPYPVAAMMMRMLTTGDHGTESVDVSLDGIRKETIAAAGLAMILGWQASKGWLSRAFGIEATEEQVRNEFIALSQWIGAQAAKAQ